MPISSDIKKAQRVVEMVQQLQQQRRDRRSLQPGPPTQHPARLSTSGLTVRGFVHVAAGKDLDDATERRMVSGLAIGQSSTEPICLHSRPAV